MSYPVLFVMAPMGFGKSTSVRHYLEDCCREHVWVSALHHDEAMLWDNICKGLHPKQQEPVKRLSSWGFPIARHLIPQLIETFKLAARRSLVIVIDDYHLLSEESSIHHVIFALAMEQIVGLRIVCIGRSVPGWLLTEMRAKQLCKTIIGQDLAFTKSEVLAYLKGRKIFSSTFAKLHAEEIWSASEGWVAAIVLLAEGLRQGHKVTPLESTHDLLENTLFQSLSEEQRQLLMQLTVFEEFSLAQAEAVLQNKSVKTLIHRLYMDNTLVTYDISSNSYKIHTLLRTFLEHKAIIHNVDITAVTLSLARWEYASGKYSAALKHYHACGRSAEFFEQLSVEERVHIPFEQKELCYSIFNSMPLDTSLRFPLIYTFMSLYFLASGITSHERFAMKCIAYLRRNFGIKEIQHPQRERILCELQIAVHTSHFNDPYKIMDIKNCQYKDVLREIVAPHASMISISAGLPSCLFCLYRKAGELDAVVSFSEKHFDCEALGGLGYGFDKLLHAEKHFERGELEQARFYAEQAVQKAWMREQMYIIASAHALLARIALHEGNGSLALSQIEIIKFGILDKLSFTPTAEALRVYALIGDLCEIIVYSFMQNTKRIFSCIQDFNSFGKEYFYKGLGIPELIKIKTKLVEGEFSTAEIICDYYDEISKRYPSQMGTLRSKIFRSIVNAHLYGVSTATRVLTDALEEAAMDGVIMPFAENATMVLPLFELLKPSQRLPETFLSQVREICLCSRDTFQRLHPPTAKSILSKRENEVFALLAKGLSQKNIAESLTISVMTVKRHLENIYQKLEVHNRIEALNKGLMLGL